MTRRRNSFLMNSVAVMLIVGSGIFIMNFVLTSRCLTFRANDDLTAFDPAYSKLSAAYGLQDISGNYITHPFAWPAREWASVTAKYPVCLTTQASVNLLFWVAWQAKLWNGPLSVSIFAPGSEFVVASAMVSYLRKCFPSIRDKVAFHLVHTRDKIPDFSLPPDIYNLNCSNPQESNKILMDLRDKNEPQEKLYPQNLVRNLARRTCPRNYTITVDVDMLPVSFMAENLTLFLNKASVKSCKKCAYVIPTYELNSDVNSLPIDSNVTQVPKDKLELLCLLLKGQARRYHLKLFSLNQHNSHLADWEVKPRRMVKPERNNTGGYEVLYNITTYQEYWEPIIVVPYSTPLFDERFVGYGFTRSSQKNRKRYLLFKEELHVKLNFTIKKANETTNQTTSSVVNPVKIDNQDSQGQEEHKKVPPIKIDRPLHASQAQEKIKNPLRTDNEFQASQGQEKTKEFSPIKTYNQSQASRDQNEIKSVIPEKMEKESRGSHADIKEVLLVKKDIQPQGSLVQGEVKEALPVKMYSFNLQKNEKSPNSQVRQSGL